MRQLTTNSDHIIPNGLNHIFCIASKNQIFYNEYSTSNRYWKWNDDKKCIFFRNYIKNGDMI